MRAFDVTAEYPASALRCRVTRGVKADRITRPATRPAQGDDDEPGNCSLATVFDYIDDGDESIQALSLILAAWDRGEETGVAPQLMAYAALFTALSDLVAIYGEDAVAELALGLEQRVRTGEFTISHTRH